MLWNKTVLGRSETYTISDLMKMQKEAGEERGACEPSSPKTSFAHKLILFS
jgi:hypothetical protein